MTRHTEHRSRFPLRPEAPSRRRVLSLALAGVAGSLAIGCTRPDPRPAFAQLRFTHLPPLRIAANRVDIREAYEPPLARPNVEHEMPLPPARAAQFWADDRLQPTNMADNTVRLTIHDAAVTEKALALTQGLRGAFQTDQSERYDAVLDATLELLDPLGIILAHTSAKVWRHITVPEDASINDREIAWFTLVEGLMQDFDTRMEEGVRQYMGNWLS